MDTPEHESVRQPHGPQCQFLSKEKNVSYKGKQEFNLGKFTLGVDPWVVPPENRFEPGSAVQYGADFQMQFSRLGHQTNKIGFAQLIFPSVDVGNTSQVFGMWTLGD
jgi:hypothetical protein